GYEAAVGAALGTFADALLAESVETASAVADSARERDLGKLRTVIAETRVAEQAPEAPGLVRVVDVLTEAPVGVRGLLSRSYIAEDMSAAISGVAALRSKLAAGSFTVVTRSGDVLTEHTLTGGSDGAPSRIELTAELEQAQARQAVLANEIEAVTVELAEQRATADRLKAVAKNAYTELRAADARLAEHARQRQQLVARAEATSGEAERAHSALRGVEASEREAADELRRAERLHADAEKK